MQKYNVLLDTNIYRKNPSRTDLPFQALERLCKAKIVTLHLPYIVEREFQTQQVANYKKDLEAATSAINSMLRKGLSADQTILAESTRDSLTNASQEILSDVDTAITDWAMSLDAIRHPITEQQAVAAMESYFQGKPPLKAAKTRDDIPDSFIFQTILSISSEEAPLIVVAEDGKIAEASEAIKGVTVHRSLSSFIESSPMQTEILDLDVIDNLEVISEEIRGYEDETSELSFCLRMNGNSKLLWKKIYSSSIPDDDNEATITGYNEPEDIEFDFDALHYFGSGNFGLPFTYTTTVSACYYIFKADYYCLKEERMPSVSDHNDHYFEAEEDFEVSVTGLLKLSVAQEEIKNISAETLGELISFEIDSIDSIRLA